MSRGGGGGSGTYDAPGSIHTQLADCSCHSLTGAALIDTIYQ